jgi:predicted ATPase/DNA-binding CsgD family transcriptional regulator
LRRYDIWVGEPTTGSTRELRGLTHALTSFVGRSDAVQDVAGLLDRYRLVTVTGPGGVGKTRLADEVLGRVADRFADGVWVVELAAVQEPVLVPATVATVLGLHQAAGVSLVDALAARLAQQQLLLVLDNCEHVLDAVAQLCAAVLLSADDIRILATSREPLGLPEEARYRLPPLALPDLDGSAEPVQAEAVTLFVERARQFDPRLDLDGESRAMVEHLVKRLDGMPLAIELAAARIEALGLAQLLDRLDDRFRLLTSANRGVAARQRSLEAAVDWSYQLLSEPEQRVFRFLSVFPGPFTLDAAEAVAGTDAELAVLRLVDCSLLLPPRPGPDGRSRYSMLETLRQYAQSRLRQGGEADTAASALVIYALSVAEQVSAQMGRSDHELSAAQWLDAEDGAVHQGLVWALENDPPAALGLALALAPWWLVRGRWVQGYALLLRTAELADRDSDTWCAVQIWLGLLAYGASDLGVVLGHNDAVVNVLKDGPPSTDLVDGLVGRSGALRNMGRLEEAATDASRALELACQIEYVNGEAWALRELSCISMYTDHCDDALDWATRAQQVASGRTSPWTVRKVKEVLLCSLVLIGHLDGVLDRGGQLMAEARAAGDLSAQADTLNTMTDAAIRSGRLDDAQAYLREAAELAVYAGYTLRLLDLIDQSGHLCAATGRYAEAITLWSAMTAQNETADMADTAEAERHRELPLRDARSALDAQQVKAAENRGAAMTLAAAMEFAVMMASENAPGPTALPGPGTLSARERELVALVAQGQTDAQIAEKLFISVSTVRTHLDRIRDKSGCRRRADLTRLALQEGII